MTVSKETTTEREVWPIPTEEREIKVFERETEDFIRDQIEAAIRGAKGPRRKGRRNLAIIEEDKATLTSERRKDDPRILERKWIEGETFLQVLTGVMGGGEPVPSWTKKTLEGTEEIFPSWRLTEREGTKEECQVFFVKSSQISLLEKRVTSINWSVVAWRQPKRFQFLRDFLDNIEEEFFVS